MSIVSREEHYESGSLIVPSGCSGSGNPPGDACCSGRRLGSVRAVTGGPSVVVDPSTKNDVSPPLRTIPPAPQDTKQKVRPLRPLPPTAQLSPALAITSESAVQNTVVATGAPVSGPSFDGIGQGFTGPQGTFTVRYAPPDNNSAVGPNHIVETVNVQLAVFNKSGTALYGPVAMNTVWSGFGGLCEADNDGDPSVLHDRQADRWIISQFAVTNPNPYLLCVAVSASGDPSGSYYRYSFPYTNMPDYPKFAVWADGYYWVT